MSLGEIVKMRRREAGLTQAELALRLGVSQPAVGQWELGASRPRAGETTRRLAEFLDRPYGEVLVLANEEPTDPRENLTLSEKLDQVLEQLVSLNRRVLVLEGAGRRDDGDGYAPRDSNPEPNDSELPAAVPGCGAVILPWPRRSPHPELVELAS